VSEEVHAGFWWGYLRERGPFGRHRHRRDNIKMDLQEVGWGSMYWVDLAQDRDRWLVFVSAITDFQVP
jgi:hypothetical protein